MRAWVPSGPTAWLAPGVALAMALVLFPIGFLVFGSFDAGSPLRPGGFTLANYARGLAEPRLGATILNTLVFTFGQGALALVLGTALAWVIVRTNTPGRRIFEFLLLLAFLFPVAVGTIAWTMLLSPGKGLLNQALMAIFALEAPPFDIYTIGGMVFVQGLYLAPLVYLMVGPVFASIDAGLEESARMSGAGPFETFRRVTLPLATPGVLAAGLLLIVLGIESFDVPQILGATQGVFTYPSLIYNEIAVRHPPDYGRGTALAVLLLAVSIVLVMVYRRATAFGARYQAVRGSGQRIAVVDLGAMRLVVAGLCWVFFALAIILPLMVLAYGSLLRFFGRFNMASLRRLTLENYAGLVENELARRAFVNSLVLSAGAGAICVVLAGIVAFAVLKTRMRGRWAIEGIAMLPISVPSTVLALGLLWGYLIVPLPVYGTQLILVIAFVTRYLPITLRTVSGGLIQLSDEFDEAARMAGAGFARRFVSIILPLLKPTLLAAWLIMFMTCARELSMSLLLSGPGNPVVSVLIYGYYEAGQTGQLAAMSVSVTALMIVAIMVVRFVFKVRIAGFER